MSRETNPHEANLLDDVSFTKGCYIGQEVVARLDTYEKVQRFLRGVRFDGEEAPAPGAGLRKDGKEVGRITSAAFSPREGRAIALALVRKGFAGPGTRLEVGPPAGVVGEAVGKTVGTAEVTGGQLEGEVVVLPFVDPGA